MFALLLLLTCVAVAIWFRPRAVTAPELGTGRQQAAPNPTPGVEPVLGHPAPKDPAPDSRWPSAGA